MTAIRQFTLLVTLATLGAWLVATDTHRHLIAWAWPFIVSFNNTYIAF